MVVSEHRDRPAHGPWDEADVDFSDGVERVDLGGLLVAAHPGIDVQVQVDQSTGAVVQLTLARADAAVQLQPYAAPRSGGLWDDVRRQLSASISQGGGLVEEADGAFGIELRAQVPASDGAAGLQPARFVGIEGPRWFLRAVFLGAAARPGDAASDFDALVRTLAVVRGNEAMPVGSPIPLRLPEAPAQAPAAPQTISLPVRGPEITETR